jgi:hypothetical protein
MIVGHEQEAALQQVLAQPRDLLVGEIRRAAVLDEREPALEQLVVCGPDDDELRLAFAVHRDGRLGQLRQPHAEIDVGAGIVRAPALLFTAIALEHEPAEVEPALEGVGCREARRGSTAVAAIAAAPDLRADSRCAAGEEAGTDERGDDAPPAGGHSPSRQYTPVRCDGDLGGRNSCMEEAFSWPRRAA